MYVFFTCLVAQRLFNYIDISDSIHHEMFSYLGHISVVDRLELRFCHLEFDVEAISWHIPVFLGVVLNFIELSFLFLKTKFFYI